VLAVVIATGAVARFVAENVKAPPAEPSVVFCTATVAAFTFSALVIVQVICAAAKTLAAGIVSTLPASVPKLAGLPVIAAFASEHDAADAAKLVAGVSVIVTAVLNAVTLMVVGAAGVAVLVEVVVIAAGADARLVAENVKGPPMAPDVIFCNATVAGFAVLVKVQAIESPYDVDPKL
jgi:ribosomal protein S28E/S33